MCPRTVRKPLWLQSIERKIQLERLMKDRYYKGIYNIERSSYFVQRRMEVECF